MRSSELTPHSAFQVPRSNRRAFANTFEFDPAKPLTIPYGRYPHKKSGKNQLVDARTAKAFASNITAAKAAGAPGLPIYSGHPDVPDLAAKYPDKGAKGWVTDCMANESGMELPVAWNDEPKPGAFIYFSPYMAGNEESGSDVGIDELKSIGLTNRPNSTRFRLPNEAEDATTGDHQVAPTRKGDPQVAPSTRTSSMKKVLTLLGLAETATEDEATAKLQGLMDGHTAALTRTAEEHTAALAFANEETTKVRAEFANERDAHIGLLLDCAIRDGRVTPATKPVWAGRLRQDFANEAPALATECAKLKTRTALANTDDDSSPTGILAKYNAMPKGAQKAQFLRDNAQAINDARTAK